jgi:hypothetical protein
LGRYQKAKEKGRLNRPFLIVNREKPYLASIAPTGQFLTASSTPASSAAPRDRLSLAVVSELEDRRNASDAKATANADIFVDRNFLCHNFPLQGNDAIIRTRADSSIPLIAGCSFAFGNSNLHPQWGTISER